MNTYRVIEDFKGKMNQQLAEALYYHPCNYSLTIRPLNGKTVVTIADRQNDKIAFATRNPKDSMDMALGMAIAWARLNSIKIPDALLPNENANTTLARRMKVGRKYHFPTTKETFKIIAKNYDRDEKSFIFTAKKGKEFFVININADDGRNYVYVD
jgi:hypothetical protein